MSPKGKRFNGWRGALAGSVVGLFIAASLTVAQPAGAASSFCPAGSGAGQCNGPNGVGVDEASGDVYVADTGNNRVDVFDSTGVFRFAWGYGVADGVTEAAQTCGPEASPPTPTCFPGLTGNGSGQFSHPTRIAIDNYSAIPAVYVGTDNFRVQKFSLTGAYLGVQFGFHGSGNGQFEREGDPIAVGPGGTVYVCDSRRNGSGEPEGFSNRVEQFDAGGTFIASVLLSQDKGPCETSLVVDSSGNLYTHVGAFVPNSRVQFFPGIYKYSPSGVQLAILDPAHLIGGVAVDSAGNVFADQEVGGGRVITEFNESEAIIARFGYGAIPNELHGLAVRSATHDLYGSTGLGEIVHLTPPPPGPLAVEGSVTVDPGNTKARVHAEVNPEGKPTTYHFEYISEADYQADGGSFGTGTVQTPESGSIGSDFELHAVEAEIGCAVPINPPQASCLVPETEYRFRIVTKDSEGHENTFEGEPAPFKTLKPLEIKATWTSEVGSDSAVLHAEVDPLGIAARGGFQYVDDAHFQSEGGFASPHTQTTGTIDFGAGEGGVSRSATVSGLLPATTYHYRLVAEDDFVQEAVGPEHSLKTQPVLPPAGPGACPNESLRSGVAIYLPDCRAYEMVSPLDKEGGDIIANGNFQGNPARLDQSATGGGKLTYSTYRAAGDAQSAPFTSQYIAERGLEGWSSHAISPVRGINILKGQDTLDSEFRAFSEDLCAGWLLHDSDPPLALGAPAGYANLYRSGECGGEGYEAVTTVKPPSTGALKFVPEIQGLSASGAEVVYRANDKLTPNAPSLGEGSYLVYASSGGKQRLICVLPGGVQVTSGCSAGTAFSFRDSRSDAVFHAVSADGKRVFWTASEKIEGPIYMRENPFGAGAECSGPAAPCTIPVSGGASARFWGADEKGTVAIYETVPGEFYGSNNSLFEFDVGNAVTRLIAHEAEGVVGMSDDASRLYFVSREVLASGAVSGQNNLYLRERGEGGSSSVFVADLGSADIPVTAASPSPVSPAPYYHTARTTADGLTLAFMSTGSPTEYDNTDINSGEPDAEVYVYDASPGGGAGSLACVSCNPTGARPNGREVLVEGKPENRDPHLWAAARLPGWAMQLYQPRYLSADGRRLFFESYEGLAPRDTNGAQDVYQWEAVGEGNCLESSPSFDSNAKGCVDLISSGGSPVDAEFLDASADGGDVFFSTVAGLLPQDPGLIDIYDARVDGGLPSPSAPQAPCEGEACQSPPAPPAAATPSSAAFRGPGNLALRKGGKRCGKHKRRVVHKGKARCVSRQKRRAHRRHDSRSRHSNKKGGAAR